MKVYKVNSFNKQREIVTIWTTAHNVLEAIGNLPQGLRVCEVFAI